MLSNLTKTFIQSAAVASLLFSASFAMAQPQDGERGERPRMPPPEAVEACAALIEGDVCSFEGRRGTVEGLCILPEEDSDLACAPEGGPQGGREGGREER